MMYLQVFLDLFYGFHFYLYSWWIYMKQNKSLCDMIDVLQFITKQSVAYYYRYRIEPFEAEWIYSSYLINYTNDSLEDSEYVEFDYELISANNSKEKVFQKTSKSILSTIAEMNSVIEGIVILRNQNQYFVQSYFSHKSDTSISQLRDSKISLGLPIETLNESELNGEASENNENNRGVVSKVKLLSIEYTHPDMSSRIYLEINDGFYQKNNILFSPLFVRRCLEYQPLSFVFNDSYVLRIMDNELNFVELTSQHYLVLDENNYTIRTV